MAVRLNKIYIAGNLTRDPQTRFFANERAVANFGLACNRRYRTADGETKEETTFVDIECWGRTAELVGQYLTKGRACLVEGRLKMDSWEDRDGNRRTKHVIVADNVQFLDGGGGGQRSEGGQSSGDSAGGGWSDGGGGGASSSPAVPPPSGAVDDDPPF